MSNGNTWGLAFVQIDTKKDQFNELLSLNLGSEHKAREVFDRIKRDFKENNGEPDGVIDLIDENEEIIEDYVLTTNQLITVAAMLGHVIEKTK
ncbi:hypothetical protein [Bacillus pumilus]|uniref:hypothetical protein n=1 Tax=Bacillus pumilus TaxID=1408 RepID=UPI00227EAE6A|nr:hypothetical protein [Bacillus pumilus]MCY7500124.1 hypothetical protein [Bacillus pumilus]MCY7528552.1 hypothetical protein [Bacillus pumilus]MED4439489.1 hypothetical protein [Bacillus pumilus]MED4489932.1 hypothetical protein [Bacillus pumilus]